MLSNRPFNSLHCRQPAREYQTGVTQSPSIKGKLADSPSQYSVQCTVYCIRHVHETTILNMADMADMAEISEMDMACRTQPQYQPSPARPGQK